MTRATELRLILRARGGDELAFQALLREHHGLISGLTHSYFAKGADRQDMRQEARIGFWKAIRDYSPPHPFGGFAALCVRRQLITAAKTADRGKHQVLNDSVRVVERSDDFEDALPLLGVDHRDPSAVLEQREQFQEIGTAIRERLTESEYLCLRGITNGESYEGIGAYTGLARKQIDNALQRARRKLREDKAPTGWTCPGCEKATVSVWGGQPRLCVICRVGGAA